MNMLRKRSGKQSYSQYPAINLIQEMKDLYSENYKKQNKTEDLEDNTRR
jgi:hypothetical protein